MKTAKCTAWAIADRSTGTIHAWTVAGCRVAAISKYDGLSRWPYSHEKNGLLKAVAVEIREVVKKP